MSPERSADRPLTVEPGNAEAILGQDDVIVVRCAVLEAGITGTTEDSAVARPAKGVARTRAVIEMKTTEKKGDSR